MSLLRTAVLAFGGYQLYRWMQRPEANMNTPAAFADGEATDVHTAPVRNAGPEAMKSDLKDWDMVDQQADESFPSSDPPGNY